MNFTVDHQTISDLDIFGKPGKSSIYAIFNRTQTHGGAELLEEMFRNPLSDIAEIERRSNMIKLAESLSLTFPLKPELVDLSEKYLSDTDSRSLLAYKENNIIEKIKNVISADIEQQMLVKGISALFELLHCLQTFSMQISLSSKLVQSEFNEVVTIISLPEFKSVFVKERNHKLTIGQLGELNILFRSTSRNHMKKLFSLIYRIDVYISVASVLKSTRMTYAVPIPKYKNVLKLKNVYHPFVTNPVPNTVELSNDKNILFLTGANMAGKSTFLKSIGISIYLAHIGFPVPAEEMEFSIRDGMLTTINLSDNINSGYSHFYAEVLRVKKMAEQVKNGDSTIIIFDELFRGTNVKDAYEATVTITSLLTKKDNCIFMVSTHIMEAAETLAQQNQKINFVYLPTEMHGDIPRYTYTLARGISNDRHGMIIIQNENILSILKEGRKKWHL